MRVLSVSHEYPPIGGGGANAAYHLLSGLADRGHSVTLITTDGRRFDNQDIKNNENIDIHYVSSRRKRADSCSFYEMFDYMIKAYREAKKCVSESKYDVCLVFFGIPSGPIGYMLKKRFKLPYIIRFGGGDVPGYQKRFLFVYKIIGPAIHAIWRNASARIANSEGLRQMALDYCDKYPFDVINNGVDSIFFVPSEKKKTYDSINILFVSRLIERKGLQYIIPILPNVIKYAEEVGKEVRLTVVGEGPYRSELENIAACHGVSDVIKFVGEKRGLELLNAYQSGDIFILPSSNEGMPNVVLEAMSCGLPIIITHCQGSEELLRGNGYISTIEDFSARICELIENDNMRENMGKISRMRTKEEFSWDSVICEYVKLIERILSVY